MKDLLSIAAVLAAFFAGTFLLMQWSGLVPEAGLAAMMKDLREVNPLLLAAGIILLLVFDLFVAIPTMTTILLAGWLLGPVLGGAVSAAGLLLMGVSAYVMGRRAGRPILARLLRDPSRLDGIERAFARQDMLVLMTCQALPILPELSATLAGVSRMAPLRFLLGYAAGVIPFAFIVAAGGAASSEDDLRPAILTAIGVSVVLLGIWRLVAWHAAKTEPPA